MAMIFWITWMKSNFRSITYLTFVESEIGPIVNAHEFINYELEIDPDNPYIPIQEDILVVFNERDDAIDNERIKEVDNMQIGD